MYKNALNIIIYATIIKYSEYFFILIFLSDIYIYGKNMVLLMYLKI